MPDPVVVEGLTELRRVLKRVGARDVIKDLRDANQKVSTLVVDSAQERATTRLQRRAADTLTAARTDRAAVRLGRGFAAALGAEFGANQGQRRTGPSGRVYTGYNQFPDWRGNGRNAGYFLWPAIRDETPRILDLYANEIERIFGE